MDMKFGRGPGFNSQSGPFFLSPRLVSHFHKREDDQGLFTTVGDTALPFLEVSHDPHTCINTNQHSLATRRRRLIFLTITD